MASLQELQEYQRKKAAAERAAEAVRRKIEGESQKRLYSVRQHPGFQAMEQAILDRGQKAHTEYEALGRKLIEGAYLTESVATGRSPEALREAMMIRLAEVRACEHDMDWLLKLIPQDDPGEPRERGDGAES